MADPLTDVLVALDTARQRATYGAVAGHLGVTPRFLMRGRPRDPLHSWVVSAQTGLPTGYPDDAIHLDLVQHEHVVTAPGESAALMRAG